MIATDSGTMDVWMTQMQETVEAGLIKQRILLKETEEQKLKGDMKEVQTNLEKSRT